MLGSSGCLFVGRLMDELSQLNNGRAVRRLDANRGPPVYPAPPAPQNSMLVALADALTPLANILVFGRVVPRLSNIESGGLGGTRNERNIKRCTMNVLDN